MAETAKPQRKKPKPYNRKYDRKKVEALAELGVRPTDIAKAVDVALPTITNYLKKVGIQTGEINTYKKNKADSLALSQLKMATVTDLIANEWIKNPERLTSLDVRTQKEVLIAANSVKTYDFNSERLERGESTQNVLSIHGDIAEMKRLRMAQDGKTQGD